MLGASGQCTADHEFTMPYIYSDQTEERRQDIYLEVTNG